MLNDKRSNIILNKQSFDFTEFTRFFSFIFSRFKENGGKVENRKVNSLEEVLIKASFLN